MMKRLIRANQDIRAAQGDVIMRSKDGHFALVETSGVGINRTPWTGYAVVGDEEAKKFVVDIRLMANMVDMNGEPVEFTYRDVYVAHGFGSKVETLDETARYIEILRDALSFARQIKNSDIIG